MLSYEIFRKDPCGVANALKRRGSIIDLSEFQRQDSNCRKLRAQYEALQCQRNELARQTKQIKPGPEQILEGQRLKQQAEELKGILSSEEEHLKGWMARLPNLPALSVPMGKSEEDNEMVFQWGSIPTFSFQPKDHVEICHANGLMDFESAADISGARFVILKGPVARLHRALSQFMLDLHTMEHGYEEIQVPCLVRQSALYGTGQLPKFSEDLFKIAPASSENPEMYLIPTAEVPLTNLVANRTLEQLNRPLKWVCHSLCFRAEAGSYGKDTRGIIRQHQFEKVELVQIVRPEQSDRVLEELTRHAQTVLERLELPYRKMNLCGGDLGFSATKTYDLEVWLPSQNRYREISSCSNCGDFQARRLGARYISSPASGTQEKTLRFVHTLNGSGLAVGRTLCALLENFQTLEGNVRIPQALKPYLLGKELLF